ncbi:hypothetical protein ABPG74_012864 [Tetrahymena malaccensis]
MQFKEDTPLSKKESLNKMYISQRSMIQSCTIESPRNQEGRILRKNIDNSMVYSDIFKINHNDYSTITMEGIGSNQRDAPQINFKTDLQNNNPLSQREAEQQFVSQNMMIMMMNSSDNSKVANILYSQGVLDNNLQPPKIAKSTSLKQKMDFTFNVSLSINSKQIQDTFFALARKKGFEVLESGTDEGLVIKREKTSIISQICKELFNRQNKSINYAKEENPPLIIKIKIENNTRKCLKVVYLQRLCGYLKQGDNLIASFQQQIQKIIKKENKQEEIDEEIVFDAAFSKPKTTNQSIQNAETPFELEPTSYFMFYRILSADNYSVGQKIKEFVSQFKNSYSQINKKLRHLTDPIQNIQMFTNEIVLSLFNEFNYGKNDTKKVMPFCRIAVETYLYSKLYYLIFNIYKIAINNEQEKFNSINIKIKSQHQTIQSLVERPEFKKYQKLDISQMVFYLDQINIVNSPSEAIKYISMCFNAAKIALMENQKERKPEDEFSLDQQDALLLIILAITQTECKDFLIKVYLLFDIVLNDSYYTLTEHKCINQLKFCLQYMLKNY